MTTLRRLVVAHLRPGQRSSLFTLVLAGFAALSMNMLILFVDTSGWASDLGAPPGTIHFLWAVFVSFVIVGVHVFVVRQGLGAESRRLHKEAEAELGEAQHRFVARVSHALRTPLTGINGFAHLMRDAVDSPEEGLTAEEMIDPIIAETVDLSRMIDDLLVSAQLDTGTHEISLADVSAIDAIEAAVRRSDAFGMETEIESGDARVIADPTKLAHVLQNLVVNAHRHGSGPVLVRSRVHGNRCVIDVVDHGSGVPTDAEPWLFSTTPPDRWSPTLGLGLDVAKRLCAAMGADIAYRRVKRHTVFRVTVPLALSDSRHDQFSAPGGPIRDALVRMGKIGSGSFQQGAGR